MLSKVAKRGDMNKNDPSIPTLVIKCLGITNTSAQNFAIQISSVKTVPKCLRIFFFQNIF